MKRSLATVVFLLALTLPVHPQGAEAPEPSANGKAGAPPASANVQVPPGSRAAPVGLTPPRVLYTPATPRPMAQALPSVSSQTPGAAWPAAGVDALFQSCPVLAQVLAVLQFYHTFFVFIGLLLLVGLGGTVLLRRVARPAEAAPGQSPPPGPGTLRWLAVCSALAWLFALMVASEAVQLQWAAKILSPLGYLLGSLVRAIVWLAVAALIVYGFSGPGRELVLSLLGWVYLRYHPGRPGKDQEFDLGAGCKGKVYCVDPLVTTFEVAGRQFEKRPNAWLMRTHFGWDAPGPPR